MNKFDNIDYKVIDDFISNLPFTKSESMLEIYNYAMENNVPIIKDDVASFLQNMLLSHANLIETLHLDNSLG